MASAFLLLSGFCIGVRFKKKIIRLFVCLFWVGAGRGECVSVYLSVCQCARGC